MGGIVGTIVRMVHLGTFAFWTAIGIACAAYALRTGLLWPVTLVHAPANLADPVDQESIFSGETPTEADLIRWGVYIVIFAVYGILMLMRATAACETPQPGSRSAA